MDVYSVLKPYLFKLDPEQAHGLTFQVLSIGNGLLAGLASQPDQLANQTPVNVAGLTFRNRLGLAAGLDKNALVLSAWEKLGFGHVEIGTVTPLAQEGNPKPRLFRLVEDSALINRMGFNNDGAIAIAKRLQNRPNTHQLIVGGNIGKNKVTSEEEAYKDYQFCLTTLHDVVDYFTINISSPNTAGLRNLQAREPLQRLLWEIQNKNQSFAKPKPLFVKIAPDLTEADLQDIVNVAVENELSGIVATNTTISRDGLKTNSSTLSDIGNGGLSGKPLNDRSQRIASQLKSLMPADLVLLASGGVMTGEIARQRMNVGAELVQIYSGFIYHGPQLIKECLEATRD